MLAYMMIYHTSCRQQDRSQEIKARVKIPHPLSLKKKNNLKSGGLDSSCLHWQAIGHYV